jgi:CubicO group peptidase (beta-lactamase class C family)
VTLIGPLLTIPPVGGTASAQVELAIDDFVQEQMAAGGLPGLAVVVTRGDYVVHVKGYGTTGTGQPITADTQFYLASVSKSFTALALLQLAEAERVALDAPVQTYLPEFTVADPAAARRITLRHLLNQVSGLADAGFDEHERPQPETIAEQVARLRNARPVAPPGAEFHYFNPNYAVLARVVEVVSGVPFSDYLAARVFEPLRMTHTISVVTSFEAADRADQLAKGHLQAFGVAFPYPEMSGYLGGSGGVISTANDMAHYLIMLNNDGRFEDRQILSRDSIALMRTPPSDHSTYAMGWEQATENGRRVVEHNGILSTFTADVTLIPETREGVALLANVNSLPSTMLAIPRIKRGVLAVLAGERLPANNGLTVAMWGPLIGVIALVGTAVSLRSLARLACWAAWARTVSRWRTLPGIALPFLPSLVLAGLPWLVATASGRVFSAEQIMRSMLSISICLGIWGTLGIINGLGRIWLLARRPRVAVRD